MSLAYYPGCSLEHSSAEFNQATRKMLGVLGVEFKDVPDWTCCGSSPRTHDGSPAGSGLGGAQPPPGGLGGTAVARTLSLLATSARRTRKWRSTRVPSFVPR